MHKSDFERKWDDTRIRELLKESAKDQEIPQSLLPEQMGRWLAQQTASEHEKGDTPMEKKKMGNQKESKNGKNKYTRWWFGAAATAACLALVLFAVGRNMDWNLTTHKNEDNTKQEYAADSSADWSQEEEGVTYQKIYQAFDKVWAEQEKLYARENEYAVDDAAKEESSSSESAGTVNDSSSDTGFNVDSEDGAVMDSATADTSIPDQGAGTVEGGSEAGESYGKTNQQEADVEEADIIKNDGRYLYRVVYGTDGNYMVRVVDTKGGLKEAAQVDGFQNIQDIYVWKDKLVILEPGWADDIRDEDTADDIAFTGSAYCKIHVYDITDRSKPELYHTFTVKGSYMDSRISDGYLYFFSSCDTSRPQSKEDVKAYVPMLDGKPMAADDIMLPEEAETASYLVMASIDMERPDKFADHKALVTSADKFYVSQKNIYVADIQYMSYQETGNRTDNTKLYRYSYKDGRMYQDAEGVVKGTLRDDMAMNEYQDHLRLVTTVENINVEQIKDDISGEVIGYDTTDAETSNSLYVLDQDLQVTGKIENLAKGERVYSARFMGDTGYFVTFRETDPLFSVDLSNPKKPKILGELKISGFSEYLHFYAPGLLLGIGMEADETTGETKGMKLSMFDISDPTNVKEQSKLALSQFGYSEALYNYKAVLIDPKKNLFGFSAENYEDDFEIVYLLFSYENGQFQEVLSIDCGNEKNGYWGWSFRGTYIGDRFFLMAENGKIEEYSLTEKTKTGELEM